MSTTAEEEASVSPVYLQLLEAAGYQYANTLSVRLEDIAADLYTDELDLVSRMLEGIEAGTEAGSEGTAYKILQQRLPVLRELAGIGLDGPAAELEREIRQRFGVPAPAA